MNDARNKALHKKFEEFHSTGKVKNKKHYEAIVKNYDKYREYKTKKEVKNPHQYKHLY